MKKILLICMLLFAIVLSFAACGENDNPPSNNETPHTHTFGEWEVTVKPTCTENGTKVSYCDCGEKQSKIIVSLGHTPSEAVIEDKVEATYETDGSYKEVVRCSTCNEKLSEISRTIPMLKHTPAEPVTENVIDATCYSEGSYDTVIYCVDCNAELERTRHTVEKVAHTPATAVEENIVDSTCYSTGSKDIVVYCSVTECGKELERNIETISKKAHTPAIAVEENRIEATFEKDGSYQIVIYCSVAECYEELERTTHTLDMLVHHPGSVVIENEIATTCTKTGSYDEVIYCLDDNCGHKELSRKTITVDVIPHTNGAAIEENRVDATCYSEGRYENVVYCSVCNTELFRNTVTLAKIAHVPADVVVENLVNATCTTDGKYDEVVYCGVAECNAQISRATKIIDALGHTEVIDAAVEATCTTTGLTEGKHCYECNEVLIKQEIIFGKHSFANQICSTCGEHEYFIFTLLEDDTYSIKARNVENIPETLIIPSTFNGISVTHISSSAFADCKKIKRLLIPETIEIIDLYAFANCSNISQIVYNATECKNSYLDNVRSIFHGSGTESGGIRVTIGANVKRIPAYLFGGEGKFYSSEEDFLNVVSVDFLEGSVCEEIGFAAFIYCSNLEKIDLPETIVSIDTGAFESCYSLKSVTIPRSLTGIPHEVFNNCHSLTDVYYGGSREEWAEFSIGAWNDPLLSARKHYATTQDEYFEFNLLDDDTYSIRAKDIYNMPEHVIIPSVYQEKSVTKIENFAFAYCQNLKSITIPSSIISIGSYAFNNCRALENVNIAVGLENIEQYAFSGCESLSGIIIPDTVYNIGMYAFSNCSSITSIKIPNSLTRVSSGAFADCYSLTSIMLGDAIGNIYGYAFNNCTSLNDIYFNGVDWQWSEISVFEGNETLSFATMHFKKNVEATDSKYFTFTLLDDGTYSIGVKKEYQYNMPSLVVIPSTYNGIPVTAIDEWGFCPDRNGTNGQNSITNIVIPDSIKNIGMAAFQYCTNLRSLSIPEGVSILDIGILTWCNNLEKIYIPRSVVGIYDTVFAQCENLTDIYYCGSEIDWQDIGIGDWNGPFDNGTVAIHYFSLDVENWFD